MFCSQCGTQVPDDSAFCHNCGAGTTPTTVAPEAEAAAPPVAQPEATPPTPAPSPTAGPPVAGQPSDVMPQPPRQAATTHEAPIAPAQQGQPAQVVVVAPTSQGPNLLVRVLWWFFIGWWVGQLAILAGWFLNLTIIGLPLGLYILNRLPQIMTLRAQTQQWQMETTGAVTVAQAVEIPQGNFWLRAGYFILIGWWFSLIWLEIAWLLGWTIIGLPLSFIMFAKSAAVLTLRRT